MTLKTYLESEAFAQDTGRHRSMMDLTQADAKERALRSFVESLHDYRERVQAGQDLAEYYKAETARRSQQIKEEVETKRRAEEERITKAREEAIAKRDNPDRVFSPEEERKAKFARPAPPFFVDYEGSSYGPFRPPVHQEQDAKAWQEFKDARLKEIMIANGASFSEGEQPVTAAPKPAEVRYGWTAEQEAEAFQRLQDSVPRMPKFR